MKGEDLRKRVLAYVHDADEELLHLIKELAETYKQQTNEKDWWGELGPMEKAAIQKGLEDADNNKGVPHKEVMELFDKWR